MAARFLHRDFMTPSAGRTWVVDMRVPQQAALEMAVQYCRPEGDLAHHSDHGVEYAFGEFFQDRLRREGITMNVSRTGDLWGNAMMESFFGTMKTEWIDTIDVNEDMARRAMFTHIKIFCDPI